MSRYEQFITEAKGIDRWHEQLRGNGGFEYSKQVDQLIKLSNQINARLLIYLFGEPMGQHLAQKYVDCNRNLLVFLGQLDELYRFFILYELKTNETLFAHC